MSKFECFYIVCSIFFRILRVQPAHFLTTLFGRSIVCKNQDVNPIHTGLFLAGVVPGAGFYLHPITSLSFTSDDSNFVQNYFGLGSTFWGKKNLDQIDNDFTMMLS